MIATKNGAFIYNYLGRTREDALRRWTVGAIECYLRGGICSGCKHQDGFYIKSDNKKDKCQMKAAVLELVKKYGKPTGGFYYEI